MRRFFIPNSNIVNNKATITGSDVHHITRVLRKGVGDEIQATDGNGNLMRLKIAEIWDTMLHMDIIEMNPVQERKTFVRLFQALPKGAKFDWIVEKACELGVNELVPVISERTIAKIDEERGLKKLTRWERLALESAKQVGRSSAMSIHRVLSLQDIQKDLSPFSIKIVPWEMEEKVSFKNLLQSNKEAAEVELIIGPEGGFALNEIDYLKTLGFNSVSMGRRILKTETAAIVALGNIYYEKED